MKEKFNFLIDKLKYTPNGWETSPLERKGYYLYFTGQNAIYFLLHNYLVAYLMFCGVDMIKAGAVMAAVKIWDALNDAFFGAVFDKVKFKGGKYLPWLRISTVLTPAATVLLFCIPKGSSETVKLAWFAVAYLIWDTVYTLCDVPIYGSVTAMTLNLDERSSMLSYKSIWAGVGIGFITIVGTVFVSEKVGFGYSWAAVVIAIFAFITMCPVLKTLKERHVPEEEETFTLRRMFTYLFKNKYLLIYYIGYFFYSATDISGTLSLFVSYYLFNNTLFSLVVGACGAVPAAVAAFLVPHIIRRVDKMKLYSACVLMMVVISVVIWFAGFSNIWVHIALYIIRAVPVSIIGVLMFVFTPDCAEYGKYKSGIDAKGITFAIQTFMVKVAAAVAGPLSLFLLGLKSTGWVNYDNAESFEDLQRIGATQSGHAKEVLWFTYVMIPAIGCAIAYICWRFYKLNDKDVQIMADCNAGKITREEAESKLSRKY